MVDFAETASRLINKFGISYPINRIFIPEVGDQSTLGTSVVGVEVSASKDFIDRGLVQSEDRVFYFDKNVKNGDTVTVESRDWFVSHAENKRFKGQELLTIAVLTK